VSTAVTGQLTDTPTRGLDSLQTSQVANDGVMENKCSAVAEMGDHLATIEMGR